MLSNVDDAAGLAAARDLGLRARSIPSAGCPRAEHDARMIAALREERVDLVCLAGYMRIISPAFVAAFPERILNVHPSLLPSFPGLHAQQQALDYGSQVAGCTVHLVDEAVDHGVILLQRTVPVRAGDTVQTLSDRILVEEHLAYPEAIHLLLGGRYRIEGRRFLPSRS